MPLLRERYMMKVEIVRVPRDPNEVEEILVEKRLGFEVPNEDELGKTELDREGCKERGIRALIESIRDIARELTPEKLLS